MKLTKIEWKNFASYGNKPQKLEFSDDPNLYLVVGENGAGKSSISDVITFGLYGKLDGKTLKDIPNRINGCAWVKITFMSNGHEYAVERGLEPNIFKIYIDSIPYDKAGSKSVQEYLTEDVIQIPNYVFNNTISLSINDFKSFLKMTTKDKKSIIDKIFGFYIINEMKDLMKDESKAVKETMIRLNAEIDSLSKTLNKTQNELDYLSQMIKQDSENKIGDLEDKINKFTSLLKIHSEKLKEFQVIQNSYSTQAKKAYSLLTEAKSSHREILGKIQFYKNDKCPTCASDLVGAFHEGVKEELNKKLVDFASQIEECQKNYNDLTSKEKDLYDQKIDLDTKGNKIAVNINTAKDELKKLKSSDSNEALKSLKRISEETRKNMQEHTEEKSKGEKKAEWIKKIEDVLGDKGIKQLALKTILPALNAHIADLMLALHLSYTVRFDEDFDASIIDMGEEISISTLSTGEMKKVDFVVLLSVLKLMKIRFSSVNLLFLDEIFSSIDPDGVYTILSTLRKICDELGLNVFVINHAPMPTEIFDYKIEIQKRNKFSDIKIEKV
jgi:DNA repair exonuclease SbcCD ATPase subunit